MRLHTFGDSILDCARYNDRGVTPGGLLVRNDDRLFPAFAGRDLATLTGAPVELRHRAVDGATSADLREQIVDADIDATDVVLITIGGNDLLQEMLWATDASGFRHRVAAALTRVRHAQVFAGNVYDPSFGDDERSFLDVDPGPARRRLAEVNAILAAESERVGARVVDLHAHFLNGDASWFAATIEPSLTGASAVRRAFLEAWETHRG